MQRMGCGVTKGPSLRLAAWSRVGSSVGLLDELARPFLKFIKLFAVLIIN
jgi:hypothetical protein